MSLNLSHFDTVIRLQSKVFAGGWCALALVNLAVPAAATQSAEPRSISTELQASSGSDLISFYRARNFQPLWVTSGTFDPAVLRFPSMLRNAGVDGVVTGTEVARQLEEAIARARQGNAADLAHLDVSVSRALVAYVKALRRPVDVDMEFFGPGIRPATPSIQSILNEAAAAPSPAAYLDGISNVNPVYDGLRKVSMAWSSKWQHLPAIEIPAGPSLGPGSHGERIRVLRERLGLSAGDAFDQGLANVLTDFKSWHNLPGTPLLDAATVRALNENPKEIARKLALNLDRARAFPNEKANRYVVVDTGSARLWMIENGRVRETLRVIVGKPTEPTPMIGSAVQFAVLNPYWNVPPDLVRKRIAPNVLQDGIGYLRTKGYELFTNWSDKTPTIAADKVNWSAVASGKEPMRVRQLPGPGNMMGVIKLEFPNDRGVYLHDTPNKDLFDKADRKLSSGCIRVENIGRLAAWMFGSYPNAGSSQPEQMVELKQPVPIYITYLTVAWDVEHLKLVPDAYERDAAFAGRQVPAAIAMRP